MLDARKPNLLASSGALAGAAALVFWGGCSVTESNYELMSFLFDGVPEPVTESEIADATNAEARALAGGLIASAHTAYLERRCSECHGDTARFGFVTRGFSDLTEEACAGCHADSLDAPRLHGPVAVGACLVCHRPHASEFPLLLVKETPGLCLECHGGEMEAATAGSPHEDLERDCLECHYAHGGVDRFLIRPSEPWPDEAATSPPAPAVPAGIDVEADVPESEP